MSDNLLVGCQYLEQVFYQPEVLLRRARHLLRPARDDFDVLVVTGISGVLFGSMLARSLKKDLAIVRKRDDRSTHSGHTVEGWIGPRALFVDDLVASGDTRRWAVEQYLVAADAYEVEAEFIGEYLFDTRDYLQWNKPPGLFRRYAPGVSLSKFLSNGIP